MTYYYYNIFWMDFVSFSVFDFFLFWLKLLYLCCVAVYLLTRCDKYVFGWFFGFMLKRLLFHVHFKQHWTKLNESMNVTIYWKWVLSKPQSTLEMTIIQTIQSAIRPELLFCWCCYSLYSLFDVRFNSLTRDWKRMEGKVT